MKRKKLLVNRLGRFSFSREFLEKNDLAVLAMRPFVVLEACAVGDDLVAFLARSELFQELPDDHVVPHYLVQLEQTGATLHVSAVPAT